ncbi:CaiB/BaiF CoA transferase family protein [Halomonas urumqiensis]|uniref:Carnitine dehydratase n=1 Tax=Halomonas urumqiensis TaxID=1684789 RepID=A0A2N7UMJ3_9GAMM|nr:CaiB/BaiF CoA-transferase family protein [Halomonas urumqiensis]PMR81629.1 carnitine dehydratase [Halomonas urumqiensis]PTB02266.1 CoA transferase [Halomonas urumqiensis]GHE21734.1 alpha-methylacyl-CoA racemase [Halomonas urumqiensis]
MGTGPLSGIKVIELAGIGPGPFAGMQLADMGAEVISVERASDPQGRRLPECSRRGKHSIALNLKSEEGICVLLELIAQADVLLEGFRPGVTERLGVGPETCLGINPRLVYARMTGWGQTGPLAQVAGHDINYIALTGALHAIGTPGKPPVAPLNLVGDFGGGALFAVVGILAALLEARRSGKGQVVDAAITDGTATLMGFIDSLAAMGHWSPERGRNLLDGGAHFYGCYETLDGKYVSVGAIEPQFYQLLVDKAGLDPDIFAGQQQPARWPALKMQLAAVFLTRTRDEWCALLEGSDACVAPVLDYQEARRHPHLVARDTYIDVDGMSQPAPAPRFSRTPSQVAFGARASGEDTESVLLACGISQQRINELRQSGALA